MTDHQILALFIFGIPLAWLITALIVGAIDRARRVIAGTPTSDTTVCVPDPRPYDWAKDEGSGLQRLEDAR